MMGKGSMPSRCSSARGRIEVWVWQEWSSAPRYWMAQSTSRRSRGKVPTIEVVIPVMLARHVESPALPV